MFSPRHVFHLVKVGGRPKAGRLSRWSATAAGIIAKSETLVGQSDADLLRLGREIRWRAKTGVPLVELLPEAFALVRESARRTMGFQHFHVQLMGGIALFEGH